MKIRPAPATDQEAEVVSELILSCSLLGVDLDDEEAVELDGLSAAETVLVNRIRRWALVEVAKERAAAEEEAARLHERREVAARAAAALAGAEQAAAAAAFFTAEVEQTERAGPPEPLPTRGRPQENIWLGASEAQRAKDRRQREQRRRRASRQEIFWWTVCAIAIVVFVVQLLI